MNTAISLNDNASVSLKSVPEQIKKIDIQGHSNELQWLSKITGKDDIKIRDLLDGFSFLQILYLISPSSVNLDWFSTDEALDLDNASLIDQTYLQVAKALSDLEIEYSKNDLELCKVGDPSSCLRFLHFLRRSYELSVDCKIAPSAEQVRIEDIKEAKKEDDTAQANASSAVELNYKVSESTFIILLKWALARGQMLLSDTEHDQKNEFGKMIHYLEEEKCVVPAKLISLLCSSALYNFIIDRLDDLNLKWSQSPVETIDQRFLEQLSNEGYLNYRSTSLDSFKVMISSKDPFYESIHSQIINAIMSYSMKDITIERIVDHLGCFPNFDSSILYPFDMEDALLIWCNQCTMEHNKLRKSELIEETDDLVSGLADGKVIIAILSLYTKHIPISNQSMDNFSAIKSICSEWDDVVVSWLDVEIGCFTIHLKGILITFLLNLFKKFENSRPQIRVKNTSTVQVIDSDPMVLERNQLDSPSKLQESESLIVKNSTSSNYTTTDTEQIDNIVIPEQIISEKGPAGQKSPLQGIESVAPFSVFPPSDSISNVQTHYELEDHKLEDNTVKTFNPSLLNLLLEDDMTEEEVAEEVIEPDIHIYDGRNNSNQPFPEEILQNVAPESVEQLEEVTEHDSCIFDRESNSNREMFMESQQEIASQPAEQEEPVTEHDINGKDQELIEEIQQETASEQEDCAEEDVSDSELTVPEENIDIEDHKCTQNTSSSDCRLTLKLSSEITLCELKDSIDSDNNCASHDIEEEWETEPEEFNMKKKPKHKRRSFTFIARKYPRRKSAHQEFDKTENRISVSLSSAMAAKDEANEMPIISNTPEVHSNDPQSSKGLVFYPLNDESELKNLNRTFSRISERANSSASRSAPTLLAESNHCESKGLPTEYYKRKITKDEIVSPKAVETQIADSTILPTKTTPCLKKSPVIPKKKQLSNKNLIKNALVHVCLAGKVNENIKQDVLKYLLDSKRTHFLILFRQVNNFCFRGLYVYDEELDKALKLYKDSLGPDTIDASSVAEFYKYDSGGRTFKVVPTKSFGKSIHAIAISGYLKK